MPGETASPDEPGIGGGLSLGKSEPAIAVSNGKKPSAVVGLVKLARPRQWLKNILLFVAPGAAGDLTDHGTFLRAAAGFGVFCLAASSTYYLNDAFDYESDKAHPKKSNRPVASGAVSVRLAVAIGIALSVLALLISLPLAHGKFTLAVAVYLAITLTYSSFLKHEPLLDLACVSSGFVLRAIAGGIATGVFLSDWFLIVVSFGSLLIVAGKRSAEHLELGDSRGETRRTLGVYPRTYLVSVRVLSASVTVTAYCLWAFERAQELIHHHAVHPFWFQLSIVPFVLAILALELRFESGYGSAPEDLAVHDRTLQVIGACWLAVILVGVYT